MKMKTSVLCKLLTVSIATLSLSHQAALAQTGFEPPFAVTGDNAIGDVGVRTSYQGIDPTQGARQILLTTVNTANASDGDPNQSGTNAVSSSALSLFSGVAPGTLVGPGNTLATEGSAFRMEITMAVGQILSFNYTFLTNEDFLFPGPSYHPDFAFVTLTLGGALQSYQVIDSANNAEFDVPDQPPPGLFFFASAPGTFQFIATTAGTYTLGIGVADATTTDIASGLLVDNITVVPEPSTVAFAVLGLSLLAVTKRFTRKARS